MDSFDLDSFDLDFFDLDSFDLDSQGFLGFFKDIPSQALGMLPQKNLGLRERFGSQAAYSCTKTLETCSFNSVSEKSVTLFAATR